MKHTALPYRLFLYSAIMIFSLIALTLAGCSAPSTSSPDTALNVNAAAKPRLAAPSFEVARVPQLVESNNALAFDLYRRLFDEDANLVYAPHSLSTSLAMAYAGAGGQTEVQMAKALHFDIPQSQLHPAFNALDQAISHRAQTQFQSANALWGSQQSTYRKPFLDVLAENYGTGVRLVDFEASEHARQTINQWVSTETDDHISTLLPPDSIQGNTDLVLTNAVYFKTSWADAFEAAKTQEQSFTLLNGQQVYTPMMNGSFELPFTQVGMLKAVELPFEGGAFSMLILLPERDVFISTVESLDNKTLNTILETISPTTVQVSLPKFQFDSAIQMKDPLIALGMVDAFENADFSGIDGSQELFIDQVYHQAFISVDETGSEAAAGSAVVMSRKGGSTVEMAFNANQPFIFLIRDVESGAVLFLGHVLNPDL